MYIDIKRSAKTQAIQLRLNINNKNHRWLWKMSFFDKINDITVVNMFKLGLSETKR